MLYRMSSENRTLKKIKKRVRKMNDKRTDERTLKKIKKRVGRMNKKSDDRT